MSEEMKNLGEQPALAEVQAEKSGVENGTEMLTGSPLGKFKDAQKLLDAYNELQSEFTRKCQKLSDAEKKLQDMSVVDNSRLNQQDNEKEFAWKEKIDEFLQSHEKARDLMEDIASEFVNNESLSVSPDGLERAYINVIEKNYVPYGELAKNNEFLEKYIYSNDQIKNKIIEEYVSTLNSNQNPIAVTNDGFSRGIATSNKFGSLEDARKYVESMFRF